MARNNTGNVFGFLALGVATVAGGAAIGYYVIGGAHPGPPAADARGIEQAPVPSVAPAAPPPPPAKPKPTRVSSDYVAPGAPRIHIVEDKTPTLNDSAARPPADRRSSDGTDTTDIPTPDAESSQQGTGAASASAQADTGTRAASGAAPATPAPSNSASPDTEGGQTGVSGAASAPATPAPSNNAAPDAEGGQTGDAGGAGKPGGRAHYRVQAGAFADAGDARDYVNSLHDHGYPADLRSEHQDGKTVYKVQVGAYRDRAAADQAATDFRHNGVPVTVSPVNP